VNTELFVILRQNFQGIIPKVIASHQKYLRIGSNSQWSRIYMYLKFNSY